MRTAIFFVLALAIGVVTAFAQTPPVFRLGQPLTAQWGPSEDEAITLVDGHQYQMDTDTVWVNVGQAPPKALYTAAIPQARLTVGSHTYRVRACRGVTTTTPVCGLPLSGDFVIDRPVPGVPKVPTDGVIVPTTPVAAITIPDAIKLADAYALWTINRTLDTAELSWLGARHGQRPFTKPALLITLDEAYAELAK
jgi:hypothetical protein